MRKEDLPLLNLKLEDHNRLKKNPDIKPNTNNHRKSVWLKVNNLKQAKFLNNKNYKHNNCNNNNYNKIFTLNLKMTNKI